MKVKLSRHEKNIATWQIIKRVFKYAKKDSKYLYLSLFCYLVSSILLLLIPLEVGYAINYIVGENQVNFDKIIDYMILIFIFSILSAIFDWLASVFENVVAYKTEKRIEEDLFDKILNMPFSTLDKVNRGDYISRMVNDISNLGDGFVVGVTTIFSGLVTIFGTIILMYMINPVIASLIVFTSPLSILTTLYIANKSKKMYKDHLSSYGDESAYIEEMIGNQKIVKAFSYEKRALDKFDEYNENMYKTGVKSHFYGSLTNPCTRFINGLVYLLVGGLGCVYAIKEVITVGMISVFLSYASEYAKPFSEISGVVSDLQTALASSARVFEMLDKENQSSDADKPLLVVTDGNVDIENISFSYYPAQELIKDFSLKIEKGQKVAIVGPTGCGKTTFINLIMRFYDVTNGVIKIDNIDTKSVSRDSLRANFGMVLQETWLFRGTIEQNIAFGKPGATQSEIIDACKKAGAHDFIERLEMGYKTMINENADNISSGQKQLMCIARAMLCEPKMLILDEATSNIDTRSELLIQEAFDKMMEGKTSFVVAHRLSTIEKSDIIIVMNSGHIVEQGTHKELMKKQGFYYELYSSQFK